jgi:hypothetical protein
VSLIRTKEVTSFMCCTGRRVSREVTAHFTLFQGNVIGLGDVTLGRAWRLKMGDKIRVVGEPAHSRFDNRGVQISDSCPIDLVSLHIYY